MITKNRLAWAIVAAIAVVLLVAAPMAAKSTVTEYECGEEVLYTLDPGSTSFPGGNLHIRGMVNVYAVSSDPYDARTSGTNTVVVNANWDENWLGPMWGTFSFETVGGGVWEGTWQGQMTESGSWYHASGTGQGIYKGMKIWIDSAPDSCRGRIMDHD